MNFFRDAGQHERNTGQFLAEPVVQVAADALALAQRDLQQIALPLLALGDLRVRQPRPARRKAEQHPALPGRGLEQLEFGGQQRLDLRVPPGDHPAGGGMRLAEACTRAALTEAAAPDPSNCCSGRPASGWEFEPK